MTDTIDIKVGTYTAEVTAFYGPLQDPEIQHILFTPALTADSVRYTKDVYIPKGKTIASEEVIIEYLHFCKIDDEWIYELIEKEL
jgi:hypothetical protein